MHRSLPACWLVLVVALTGCGSSTSGGPLPLPQTVLRHQPGEPNPAWPCSSWLGVGIAAAFCASGQETPAPADSPAADTITFTGTRRSASQGGVTQAAGMLPGGHRIGVRADTAAEGTLLAQGICDGTLVRASFDVHFAAGDTADLAIVRNGETPVIMLTRNGRATAPDRELLVALDWLPDEATKSCAFSVR